MQQSVLEQFENIPENELAQRGLCPVPCTETDETIIYLSQPAGIEVGQKVDFNIQLCRRNNKKTSRMPVGKIKKILPGGRVLIQGVTETGLYNRAFVSCGECAAGVNGDGTCKEVTYSGCFSEPLER